MLKAYNGEKVLLLANIEVRRYMRRSENLKQQQIMELEKRNIYLSLKGC